MGSQHACCCSADGGAFPASFDMVTPHQPQALFLKQLQQLTVDEAGFEKEAPELYITKSSKRGNDNPVRARLLAATRQDDAPGVLQCVADGAEIADMSEALRLAAQRGAASVVRELVAVGLPVNDGDIQSGYTPLQLAAATGHTSVCELLLDALADVHKSVDGKTALSLARKLGNVEVEEILERHAASLVSENDPDRPEDSQWSRRAHVLPRVSPLLSEAVLQALPSFQANTECPGKTSELQMSSPVPPVPQQGAAQEVETEGLGS